MYQIQGCDKQLLGNSNSLSYRQEAVEPHHQQVIVHTMKMDMKLNDCEDKCFKRENIFDQLPCRQHGDGF